MTAAYRWLVAFCFACSVVAAAMDAETLYMSDNCSSGDPGKKWRRIKLETTGAHSSVTLRSHSRLFSSNRCSSQLGVTSPEGSRMAMFIEDLDMVTEPKENYCIDYLDVLKLDSLISRFCGLLEETVPTTYASLGNELAFRWNFFSGLRDRNGFTVLLTTFTEPANAPNCPSVGPGQDGLFLCDNGRCIDNRWRCNDRDNCGDASDEKGCRGVDQYAVIVIICASITAVGVAAVAATVMCFKLRNLQRRSATTDRQATTCGAPVRREMSPAT